MKRFIALLCALMVLFASDALAANYADVYRDVLEDLYFNSVFPDGYTSDVYDIEDNTFAVYDVDGDGRKELIIQWTSTYTSASVGAIYDYDAATGELYREFIESPYFMFYNNGMLECQLMHNQTPAPDFWPYSLYQYNPRTDSYDLLGNVSAWERSYGDKYFGERFPSSVDSNGNGFVVWIGDGYGDGKWVDDDAYRTWRNSFAGEGKEVRIPFVNLTWANIYDVR